MGNTSYNVYNIGAAYDGTNSSASCMGNTSYNALSVQQTHLAREQQVLKT